MVSVTEIHYPHMATVNPSECGHMADDMLLSKCSSFGSIFRIGRIRSLAFPYACNIAQMNIPNSLANDE